MATTCINCADEATTRCAACQANLCGAHSTAGQQFISAWQLVTTIVMTALRAPRMLGELLLKELDQVAYCQPCRSHLASRRQAEQFKFMGGMLVVVLLMVGLVAVTL